MTGGRRALLLVFCAGVAVMLTERAGSIADTLSGSPIRFVLAEAAGSSNDLVARILAPSIATALRRLVVVENRPGGATWVGTRAVIDARPDGTTLLVSSTSALTVASLLNKPASHDLQNDLSPIVGIARTSWILVASRTIPVSSMPELLAFAKANPGRLNIGFAQGTGPQFVAESFKAVAGLEIVGIPYAGGSQVTRDLLGGNIQLYFGSAATTLPLIEAGALRALGSTGVTRDPLLPNVPTMAELGLPRLTLNSVLGVFGPPGVPQDVAQQFFEAARDSVRSTSVADGLTKIGYVPEIRSPQEFQAVLKEYWRLWESMAGEIRFGSK